MTRKDFAAIAAALRSARPASYTVRGVTLPTDTPLDVERARTMVAERAAWRNAAAEVSQALAVNCPRFDRARFLAACGME